MTTGGVHLEPTTDATQLCFLGLRACDDGSLRGAALVTDVCTRPIEFRVTEPMRMNGLQRALYGAVYDEHVAAELVGWPLLAALDSRIACVLVDDPRLLALGDRVAAPVLCLTPRDDSKASAEPAGPSFLLTSPSDGFEAIVVRGPFDDVDRMERAIGELGQVFARYDLLEPFARIHTALHELREGAAGEP